MAGTLGSQTVDTVVNFRVDGIPRNFLVLHHGKPSAMYDDSFNDGTILLMQDIYENRQWHSSGENNYATSTIHNYLNNAFLSMIDAEIRTEIKQVKIPYKTGIGGSTVNSGENGLPATIWLLSGQELNLGTAPLDGSTLSYFEGATTTDAKRIGYLNDSAAYWWTRSGGSSSSGAWRITPSGGYENGGVTNPNGIRPALVLRSNLTVTNTGEITKNQLPETPPSINAPSTAISTQSIDISWAESTDPDGDEITYIVERAYNGGGFTQVSATQELTFSEVVSVDWDSIQYRVKARDSYGNESDYATSGVATIVHNQPPVISGVDMDIGIQYGSFTHAYTVNDAEGDAATVTESVDGIPIRTYNAILGAPNQAEVAGNPLLMLKPGVHTLRIEAASTNGSTATRLITFTKALDNLSVVINTLPATTQPTRAAITVYRQIPAGATFTVEATNNPYDATPVWEDCTRAAISGLAHVFANQINVSPQFGIRVRAFAERRQAVGACNVSGVKVDFE